MRAQPVDIQRGFEFAARGWGIDDLKGYRFDPRGT